MENKARRGFYLPTPSLLLLLKKQTTY